MGFPDVLQAADAEASWCVLDVRAGAQNLGAEMSMILETVGHVKIQRYCCEMSWQRYRRFCTLLDVFKFSGGAFAHTQLNAHDAVTFLWKVQHGLNVGIRKVVQEPSRVNFALSTV